MMEGFATMVRGAAAGLLAALALAGASPLAAQVQSVDPDKAIDADLAKPAAQATPASVPAPSVDVAPAAVPSATAPADPATATPATTPAKPGGTYKQDDLIGAAEGVFGKGAKGLADVIRDLLKKQGEPNAYIVGREGGGAIGVGLRYGSGTLFHKGFLRPVPGDTPAVQVIARLLKPGRNLMFGEIECRLPHGALAMHATTTYALL